MDFLQSLLDNSSVPVITAFILGILTAISPCPLATNITAIGFIGKDIENRHRIFINGLLYTFGRIVTYTVLGFILIPILREGASMYMVQKVVSKYGEMLIAPVLIIIGIFMLDIIKLNIPKINIGGEGLKKNIKGSWGALLREDMIYTSVFAFHTDTGKVFQTCSFCIKVRDGLNSRRFLFRTRFIYRDKRTIPSFSMLTGNKCQRRLLLYIIGHIRCTA